MREEKGFEDEVDFVVGRMETRKFTEPFGTKCSKGSTSRLPLPSSLLSDKTSHSRWGTARGRARVWQLVRHPSR
jgi:hypothetical protein